MCISGAYGESKKLDHIDVASFQIIKIQPSYQGIREMPFKRKHDQMDDNDMPPKESNLPSSWLERFLFRKREVTVLPPPEISAISDDYLRQFCQQFDLNKTSVSTIDESDDDTSNGDVISTSSLATFIKSENRLLNDIEASDDVAVERNGQLRFYNLPYSIDSTTISSIGLKHGFTFTSVKIVICKITSHPSGAAIVDLAPGVDVALAAQTLQGADFGGRAVRVQTEDQGRRGGFGGRSDSRYFTEDDKDAKCNKCGQRGHSIKNCTERCNPCHLCAGKDHEAGKKLTSDSSFLKTNEFDSL